MTEIAPRIAVDERVRFGKPVIAGTRVPVQALLGREINPVVYSAGEFRSRLRSRHHFVTTVVREPHLFVVGQSSDLKRLISKRLAPSPPNELTGNRRPGRQTPSPPGRGKG